MELKRMNSEQVAAFDAAMREGQPLHEKRMAVIATDAIEAQTAIGLLQRRTRDILTPFDLGCGDTIIIRTRMSVRDRAEVDRLVSQQQTIQRKIANARITGDYQTIISLDTEGKDCFYRVIELITADPAITAEYLRNNEDKYCIDDLMDIYLGYQLANAEHDKQQAEMIGKIRTFRGLPARASVRPVVAPVGDIRSESMGGSPG